MCQALALNCGFNCRRKCHLCESAAARLYIDLISSWLNFEITLIAFLEIHTLWMFKWNFLGMVEFQPECWMEESKALRLQFPVQAWRVTVLSFPWFDLTRADYDWLSAHLAHREPQLCTYVHVIDLLNLKDVIFQVLCLMNMYTTCV